MRVALLAFFVLGCSGAPSAAPRPSPVGIPPESGPDCSTQEALGRVNSLTAAGRLDAALVAVDAARTALGASSCPVSRLDEARAALLRELGPAPDEIGRVVRKAWGAWLAGDAAGAQKAFSRVLHARTEAGAKPSLFAMKKGQESLAHLESLSFAGGAQDLVRQTYGAVFFDVVRSKNSSRGAPIRFVEGGLAQGTEGGLIWGKPSLAFASPDATPSCLPEAIGGAVIDAGRLAILRSKGSLVAFDLPGGARRPGPSWPLPDDADRDIPISRKNRVVLCSPVQSTAYLWDPVSHKSVRAEGVISCYHDDRRDLLVTLHVRPKKGAAPAGFALEMRTLGQAEVGHAFFPDPRPEDSRPDLWFDEPSGLLEVRLADLPKPVVRWVDLATGRQVASPRSRVRPPSGPEGLPIEEAGFDASLRSLRSLEKPGRQLLDSMPPGQNMGAGWARNGVRTADGKIVAVVDRKTTPDPSQGDIAGLDLHLLIATTAPLALRSDVPMRILDGSPWNTLLILGERYAAARWGWTFTVVDLRDGTLRATVDSVESMGQISLAPGELLISGGELHDLSLPRAAGEGQQAWVDPGFVPRRIGEHREEGMISFAEARGARLVRLGPRRYELPDEATMPPWVLCRVEEWLLPFEACAHRFEAGKLAASSRAL